MLTVNITTSPATTLFLLTFIFKIQNQFLARPEPWFLLQLREVPFVVPGLHGRTERILLGLACLWGHLAADYMHTFTSEESVREKVSLFSTHIGSCLLG